VTGYGDPAFFGDRWAYLYDEGLYEGPPMDGGPTVDFLAGMAGGGRVLELAIGTGRIGLPLAARGLAVEGVEASQAMVDRLRAKPGGDRIPVAIGDMADVPVRGRFGLVYLIFNTLFNLTTSQRQEDTFRNVARVLEPDGAFVIECFVPNPGALANHQWVHGLNVREDAATIEVAVHDLATQSFRTQKITYTENGVRLLPLIMRYCWPNELDLMAKLAGLRLAERYAGWHREPFGSQSRSHVSVYRPDFI
jgi:SAM-dependent methyltransferase